MRPIGLLVILFDEEPGYEFFQQVAMGTASHKGTGRQSMKTRSGKRAVDFPGFPKGITGPFMEEVCRLTARTTAHGSRCVGRPPRSRDRFSPRRHVAGAQFDGGVAQHDDRRTKARRDVRHRAWAWLRFVRRFSRVRAHRGVGRSARRLCGLAIGGQCAVALVRLVDVARRPRTPV